MDGLNRIAVENLFGIEGLDIAWYGIIIAVGIIAGVAIAVYQAKRRGYTAEVVFDLMIIALPLAIIGARLYYVAFEWEYYSQHPEEIIAVWNGGIAILGAVIGAIFAALIVAKWRKFPFGRLLDIGAPGLILGQAIGRWGNFINQEAYGLPVTDAAMQFFPYAVQDGGNWYLATFFYESMWNIGVFILLMWYSKRAKHDGNVFAMYMIGYGIGRLWIEGVRIQTLQLWPGMPVSQFLSAVMIIIGVVYILVMRKRNKPNAVYEGRYLQGWVEPDKPEKGKRADADQAAQTTNEEKPNAEKSGTVNTAQQAGKENKDGK